MKSNVNVGNHPIHPYLVLLPVGAFVSALIFDLVYLSTGTLEWRFAAFWTMVFGLITAVIAAVVGITDFFSLRMRDEPRKLGWTHGIINASVVILFIINLIIRGEPGGAATGNPLAWTIALNVIAVVALLISGWIGQEMVYKWGIGVPRETMDRIPATRGVTAKADVRGLAGAKAGEREEEEHRRE